MRASGRYRVGAWAHAKAAGTLAAAALFITAHALPARAQTTVAADSVPAEPAAEYFAPGGALLSR